MAQTLRQVIEYLSKMEPYMDKPVAWSIYTEDDIEIYYDDINTEESKPDVWATIVDEVQGDLDGSFINENISDLIHENIGIHYDWKEND